ncbi:MAG: ATP-binding protein [Syntrophobacterales bacterium]|jgi:signal transduction histidine kinase
MKRFQMSLRTKVVLSLTFLMASAMLLIGMVMLKVSQRDLVQAKIDQGLLLKTSVERLLNTTLSLGSDRIELAKSNSLLAGFQAGAPETMAVWKIIVTDRAGQVVYSTYRKQTGGNKPLAGLQRVMRLGVENISFTPNQGSFWKQLPEKIVLDAPLVRNASIVGAIRLEAPLADVRESLWRSQKLLLFYILIDILVLVAFGTYIFSKLVVKPVQQLAQTADRFQEGDKIPDVGAGEQNELGRLSEALNRMLQRLAENKEELRQQFISLEQANLELQRAQQEVIFSEKLASVGRLAAGIAHEIGNPVGIVLGYLDLLQRKDIEENERLELISRMDSEIQRINQTIRQLLDFSRPSSGERQIISIHPLIQETLDVLDHQLRQQDIKVTLELQAQADRVSANPDQLKQVFLNLMVNAADAMAATSERLQGGQLAVSTRSSQGKSLAGAGGSRQPLRRRTDPQEADYRHLRKIRAKNDDNWIQIQFADNGMGIAEKDQERVFDPFFTTKEVGKGTGLGLSVSIRIIETLGGRMELKSSPGEETVVSILLPLAEEQSAEDTRH